ncbi:hypothetical protein GIS00_24685 [Nakamurella sp. YIM 132087]|uniref:Uncharacterized protein n=1 Tax=Nakamurella alba TaxID=2665158 RepID=A0A7K1FSL4_9ACTN|nr:hypothetical protein [Nakamurella alba]MTD17136.1 hypothetical protein [Nakamurella alba]
MTTEEDNDKFAAADYFHKSERVLFEILSQADPDPDAWSAAWEAFDLSVERLGTAWGRGPSID